MKFTRKRNRISEANIQAELYNRLRLLGIKCYLEYAHENFRFDMVILNKDDIIGIVEIKSRTRNIGIVNKNTRQYRKYHSYGLPVIYCTNMSEINKSIERIKALFHTQSEIKFNTHEEKPVSTRP